jgi:hypothetical protein
MSDSSIHILQAEKEPILSSFLYASVLSHDCLERALSFVLANRLEDPTLLATQLIDIFNDVMMNNVDIRRSIRLDAQVSALLSCWGIMLNVCMLICSVSFH